MEMLENWMVLQGEGEEAEAVLHCDCCGEDIYNEDVYWDINGEIVCEECIREYMDDYFSEYKKIAVRD